MNWLTGGTQSEAKRLIAQLSDSTKRDLAAKELIKLGADSVLPLIDALQAQDPGLVRYYQTLATANPTVRVRVAETLGISKDKSAIPALLDAVKSEYFTVRSQAVLALGNIGDASVIPALLPLLKDAEGEVRSAACVAIVSLRRARWATQNIPPRSHF